MNSDREPTDSEFPKPNSPLRVRVLDFIEMIGRRSGAGIWGFMMVMSIWATYMYATHNMTEAPILTQEQWVIGSALCATVSALMAAGYLVRSYA